MARKRRGLFLRRVEVPVLLARPMGKKKVWPSAAKPRRALRAGRESERGGGH